MSFTPITGSALQYMADSVSANDHYIKFYASGTTAPISMATDNTGGTLLAKAQFNSQGYAINGSGAEFIPHIDQKYKIVFYPNATDADNNTFANAVFNIDELEQPATIISGFEKVKNFATLALAVADTSLVDGDALSIAERTTGAGDGFMGDVVLSSTVTENTYDIIQCTGVATLSIVARSAAKKQYSAQFLQIQSDITNGEPISMFRFIPAIEHSTIQAFTNTTDLATYFQAAADSGATNLQISYGNFIVGTQIDYDATVTRTAGIKFIGDGIGRTVFDNQVANGFLFDINQDSASKFHLGSELSGFSITQTTAPIVSGGIRIRAATFTDIRDILIDNVTGSGIQVLNSTSLDTDQNVNFSITQSIIRNTDLVAVDFDYTTNAANGYRIERNRILDCAGALNLAVAHASVKLNAFAQSVTNPQVVVNHNGLANNYDLVLEGNFFEKGRAGELRIDGCIGGRIEGNTFSSNDSSSGAFAVKFGFDQAVRSMEIKRNSHIVVSSISGTYNCYEIGTAATNNEIIRPEYSDIQSATKVSLAVGAEDNGNVITTTPGEYLHTPRIKRLRITTADTTVAPDLLLGAWNHYFFTSTGAITINKPINGNNDGASMILSIRNDSGGSITVTFGTGITVESDYSNPANGFHTNVNFSYDSASSTWRQIGRWS